MAIHKDPLRWITILEMGVLCFFMMTIIACFLTKNVLVDRFQYDGFWVNIIFRSDIQRLMSSESLGNGHSNMIDWEDKYPHSLQYWEDIGVLEDVEEIGVSQKQIINTLSKRIEYIKELIENYCNRHFVFQIEMDSLAKWYDQMIGLKYVRSDDTIQDIWKMEDGRYAYGEMCVSDEKIQSLANGIKHLNEYCCESKIPFLFVNAPSKVEQKEKNLMEDNFDYSNENADAMIAELLDSKVPTMDFREEFSEHCINWKDAYYYNDAHWKNTTQLWAAGIIANKLNVLYDFGLDNYYFDVHSYNIIEYPQIFLGQQGRAATMLNAEKENFSTVLPRFETFLTLENFYNGAVYEGAYDEAIFNKSGFEAIFDYSYVDYQNRPDAYNSLYINNYPLMRITNKLESDITDKHILIIYDSFSWYLGSFLALDVRRTDFLHPIPFNGSIITYIEKEQPDAVLVIMSEGNIGLIEPGRFY